VLPAQQKDERAEAPARAREHGRPRYQHGSRPAHRSRVASAAAARRARGQPATRSAPAPAAATPAASSAPPRAHRRVPSRANAPSIAAAWGHGERAQVERHRQPERVGAARQPSDIGGGTIGGGQRQPREQQRRRIHLGLGRAQPDAAGRAGAQGRCHRRARAAGPPCEQPGRDAGRRRGAHGRQQIGRGRVSDTQRSKRQTPGAAGGHEERRARRVGDSEARECRGELPASQNVMPGASVAVYTSSNPTAATQPARRPRRAPSTSPDPGTPDGSGASSGDGSFTDRTRASGGCACG
jgi:hypothetical protein